MRVAPKIVLSDAERSELTKRIRSKLTSVRLAQRGRVVLLAAEGICNKEIAAKLGIGRVQVGRWRGRYVKHGWAGVERDLPRGAPPRKVDVAKLVKCTTQRLPKGTTQWSTRALAAELGISAASVSRYLRANGLKTAAPRTRLQDVVGSSIHREARGCRGSVHEPSRACAGVLLRREELSAGAGLHAAEFAIEEGPRGDHGSTTTSARTRPRYSRRSTSWTAK